MRRDAALCSRELRLAVLAAQAHLASQSGSRLRSVQTSLRFSIFADGDDDATMDLLSMHDDLLHCARNDGADDGRRKSIYGCHSSRWNVCERKPSEH